MTFEKEIELLKENRIKVFRYLLVDDKINDILVSNNIEIKDFLKDFLVFIFDEVLKTLENSSKVIYDNLNLKNSISFNSKEYFYILKVLRNSIHLFFNNKKIERYLLKKSIDEVFDSIFESLFKDDTPTKNDDILLLNFKNLVENSLFYIKIDSNANIIEISKNISESYSELFNLNKKFIDYLENEKIKESFLNSLTLNEKLNKELKLINKYDKTIWFFTKLMPFYKKDKEIEFFYLILEDITLKKTINTQKKVFLEQSKMAAMGELISMIAHQWRQPLQTISILAQKLILTKTSNGYVDNDILEKTVDDVDMQVTYMSKTIDDFRNFFKPDNKKKISKLSEMIDKTIKFLHYLLTINNIDIRIEIVNDCELSIFENNIIQVLINLIKNSKDALLEKKLKDKFVIVRANFNENYAIIEVEDNAGGIPVENLDKIFESYFTTKNNENGTGLGLYMSKTIIEEHCQGKLSVENTKNGALFRILLPLK